MNQKIYIIIIVILLLVIAFFVYNQFLNQKQSNNNLEEISKEDIVIGNRKAPITIIGYYSYLCGYCKIFEEQIMPQLTKQYILTGKAKLIFRPFPPYELSQAVLCANDQEKFLEYHNYLFANNDKITSVQSIKDFAKNVGLNVDKFNQCLDSEKYKLRAEELYVQGDSDFKNANIPADKIGTPTFFINGEAIIGAVPYDDFVKIIEKKLTN